MTLQEEIMVPYVVYEREYIYIYNLMGNDLHPGGCAAVTLALLPFRQINEHSTNVTP